MRKVFFCCTGIDDFLNGSPKVAGIQVQMSFWALLFKQNGNECFTYSLNGGDSSIRNIIFIPKKTSSFMQRIKLASLFEWWTLARDIHRIKPSLVIIRGANASLPILTRVCKTENAKLIMFGASDSDFVPGHEILTNKVNKYLFHKGLYRTNYFVVQNNYQQKTLFENYKKDSLLMPNIWLSQNQIETNKDVYDAIWVSNLRRLKRAEWFVELARSCPNQHFAIVGGVNNFEYYNEIKELCTSVPNIDFLGAQPFGSVNSLMSRSRILICTSEFEGFPNTFLQAWAQSLPIITTVDPNGVFQTHQIGIVIHNVDELKLAFTKLIEDQSLYLEYKKNAELYFRNNHMGQTCYDRLMRFMNL